jgi:hypothetical protein
VLEETAASTGGDGLGGFDLSDSDIGSPEVAGSDSYYAPTDTFTISGGGSDIWNLSDQFNYARASVTGDRTSVVEMTSITDLGAAKSGIMYRDSADPAAMFVDVVATSRTGVYLQWRDATGGECDYLAPSKLIPAPTPSAPVWLMLQKSSNTFTGYYSLDGSNWILIGSTTVDFSNIFYLDGLAATAGNNAELNTLTFSDLSL